MDAKEPVVKPAANLYVNTNRGIGDLDRISIGGTISDNYGGGIGTWYDANLTGAALYQRPRADAQLLNCSWAGGIGCRIGSDYDSVNANASWNAASAFAYDYAFFVR